MTLSLCLAGGGLLKGIFCEKLGGLFLVLWLLSLEEGGVGLNTVQSRFPNRSIALKSLIVNVIKFCSPILSSIFLNWGNI